MSHKSKPPAGKGPLARQKLTLLRLLAFVALVLSVYLSWVALGGGAVAGCGVESGCDRVLQSRWSKWLGLPVSVFAVGTYGLMLWLFSRLNGRASAEEQRQAWRWLVPLAVLILGSVLWFVALQLLVMKQVCPYCMTVHGAGAIVSLVILLQAPIQNAPEKPWQAEKEVYVPPATARKLAAVAVGGLALLVLGQLVFVPRMYSLLGVKGGELKARTFKIHGDAFEFDLAGVPLMGSPQATNAILSLFDYTCHHCRETHHLLEQVSQTFSNELAVVNLPMPLDSKCNTNIVRTPPPHINACEYARLGLAVWRAKREAHPQYEKWIFAPATPPPLPQARDYATSLVGGSNVLHQALQDPWVDRQLKQNISVFATNMTVYKNGAMPQLLIGTNLIGGNIGQISRLYQLLEQQFGLRAPAAKAAPARPGSVPVQPGRPG